MLLFFNKVTLFDLPGLFFTQPLQLVASQPGLRKVY